MLPFVLNQDGTAITYTPLAGMSFSDCLARLQSIDALAAMFLEGLIDESMSDYEKTQTLYAAVTENVRYDHRYYTDRTNMPYDSQTAYGALHDQLAICGGCAWDTSFIDTIT